MFIKTAFALAIIVGTAAQAPAATRYQSDLHHDRAARIGSTAERQRDRAEFIVGNLLFVGFHELSHALIAQLNLPVLGRQEDAADAFATLALLDVRTEFAVDVLVQAVRGWFLMDRRDRSLGDEPEYSDAHGLDRQRAFQIVCLMVGADAGQFKALAEWVQLPASRQLSCREDYETAKMSWDVVLKSHRRSEDAPTSAITVAYDRSSGKFGTFAGTFHAIGFLETLQAYASSRYQLPRPITIAMRACGDTNAWWDSTTLEETLCYEMAEDFAALYAGFAQNVLTRHQAHPIETATTVKRLGLGSKGSSASLTVRSDLTEPTVTVDRLDALELGLKEQIATFFTRLTDAKDGSRARRLAKQ